MRIKLTLILPRTQIQFCLMMVNNLLGLNPSCNVSRPFLAMYIPNILILTYLFYDFYNKAYSKSKSANKVKQ